MAEDGDWPDEERLVDRLADAVEPFRLAALRHRRLLIAGCAGVAVAAAVSALAPPAPARVRVLVAAADLRAGTRLMAGDLRVAELPPDAVPTGVLRPGADLAGRMLSASLPPGLPLTRSALLPPTVVPSGRVLTMVRLADPAATALAAAGEAVDVLGSRPGAAQGTVLAARAVVVGLPADPTGQGGLLLLAVTPGQALGLAAAADADRLSLDVPARTPFRSAP